MLRAGDSLRVVADAIRLRHSGALAIESDEGVRRIVFRDGDFVTASSGVYNETLTAFLVARGDLSAEAASELGRRVPPFGRHAGAALIAHGHLQQDDLWPVLRAHAEWILGVCFDVERARASAERDLPARLQAEPAVFGGATGAEVFVEVVRRNIDVQIALERLGGTHARTVPGPAGFLLGECALPDDQVAALSRTEASSLGEVLGEVGSPEFAATLYALVCLRIVETVAASRAEKRDDPATVDPLDAEALRARILARRSLVDEGDYFALLGVSRGATGYDIRRAYTRLRKEYDPSRALIQGTVDLADDVDLIIEVLDEAYDILRDQVRRERYRRAIEAQPLA